MTTTFNATCPSNSTTGFRLKWSLTSLGQSVVFCEDKNKPLSNAALNDAISTSTHMRVHTHLLGLGRWKEEGMRDYGSVWFSVSLDKNAKPLSHAAINYRCNQKTNHRSV